MTSSLEEPFLASSQCLESCQQYQLDHQLLLLKKNVRHTWWLKVLLVSLLLPTIILFVLSCLEWSGSRHPQPSQHYIYPDMIPSESNVLNYRGKSYLLSFYKHRLYDQVLSNMRLDGFLKTFTTAYTRVIQVQI